MESPYTLKITVNEVDLYSLSSNTLCQLYMNLQGGNSYLPVTEMSKCELLDSVVKLIDDLYRKQDWKKYVSIHDLYNDLVCNLLELKLEKVSRPNPVNSPQRTDTYQSYLPTTLKSNNHS